MGCAPVKLAPRERSVNAVHKAQGEPKSHAGPAGRGQAAKVRVVGAKSRGLTLASSLQLSNRLKGYGRA